MNKIVFLDIDGVLNSDRSLSTMSPADRFAYVEPARLSGWAQSAKIPVPRWGDNTGGRVVNAICEQTGARIVVASRWLFDVGHYVTWQWLVYRSGIDQTFLHEDWGVDYDEVRPGCTNVLMKQEAIQAWLKRHPEIDLFILLDDEPVDLPAFGKRIVKCTEADGLSHKGFLKAIQLLGRS